MSRPKSYLSGQLLAFLLAREEVVTVLDLSRVASDFAGDLFFQTSNLIFETL